MDQDKPDWKDRVEGIMAKQAMALNYEYGITCRVLPTETEGQSHSMALALDLTHSGHDFDLEWVVTFSDNPDDGFGARLLAPDSKGGNVWEETHRTIEDFQRAVTGLPYLVQGYFAGRRAGSGPCSDAIHGRRSIKRFTAQPVSRDQIETLIDAAVQAPNHKLTQPWKFYVLGPESRRAYGAVLGKRKAKKAPDPEAAREVTDKVAQEHFALPAMLAVTVTQNDDPELREEDYAATYMAIQNLALAAHEMGLGTHIKTGAVMGDAEARAALGAGENERVIGTVHVGQPAEQPPPRPRKGHADVTIWRP